MFQVILANQVRKELRRLDARLREKALKNLKVLKTDPFLGEKMLGQFEGLYRVKIPPLRIIYTPDLKNKTIWVKTIGFRGKVYKK